MGAQRSASSTNAIRAAGEPGQTESRATSDQETSDQVTRGMARTHSEPPIICCHGYRGHLRHPLHLTPAIAVGRDFASDT
jgi:hypothetical protein